jgi:hypothetical protein
MKRLSIFILCFFILRNTFILGQCIEIKNYKATKVMVTVDSMKMKYPFLVEVNVDSSKIIISIDNPGDTKKIEVSINEIEKCVVKDSINYDLVFRGTITDGSIEEGQIQEQVSTTVFLEKRGTDYHLKLAIPNFNNSEFEIFMQEKKNKNEAKKN